MKNKGFFFGCGCALIILLAIFCTICFSCYLLFFSMGSFVNLEVSDQIEETYLTDETQIGARNKDKIAIVNITDAITYSIPGNSLVETGSTSNNIIKQLEQAKDDPLVKAVILRFNTPGGETLAGQPICDAVKDLKSSKTVYSFSDSSATSLGYYLATCSDFIYAREFTITGSIGVVLQATDLNGIIENFGGRVQTITNSAGDNKSGEGIFEEGSETYALYQEILDLNYEDFINQILEGREGKISRNELLPLADGRILTGKQAFDSKLVDEIAEFDEVIASVLEKEGLDEINTAVVEYYLPISPLTNFLIGLNSKLQVLNFNQYLEDNSEVKVMMIEK